MALSTSKVKRNLARLWCCFSSRMARKIFRKNQMKPDQNLEHLEVIQKSSTGVHFILKHTLLCSKLMGLLPLSGLCSSNVDKIKFSWKTPYTLIVIFSTLGQITMCTLCLHRLFIHGLTINSFSNSFFYTCSMLNLFLLLQFSFRWPNLLKKIVIIENRLPPIPKKVTSYCDVTMFIVLLTAFVEHILSLSYGIKMASICGEGKAIETYFKQSKPWIFDLTSFSIWKGILVWISNVQSTLMWSYCDLLIMVFSIYLSEHFAVHIKFLKTCITKNNIDWHDLRIQYLDVVTLVKIIDTRIGYSIILSFTANMYWICIQLFNNLNQTFTPTSDNSCAGKLANESADDLHHTLYFAYSFSFLVCRTLGVALLAARIHARSIIPLSVLYEVSTWEYSIEVRRFINQICNIRAALSGLEFFYVTRGMLLTLIGTIVTYELVLVQFNSAPATVTIVSKRNLTT